MQVKLFAKTTLVANTFEEFGQRWLDLLINFAFALVPFIVFALIVHILERVIQRRLASRFGWNSVLATGWIGTPIHEFSHVLMCWVFGHRIDAVAFFEPDKSSGRLGYVKHSSKKHSFFQEIGNVFIGIAPLAGGSIVLVGLFWLFYPDLVRTLISPENDNGSSFHQLKIKEHFDHLVSGLQNVELLSPRFWLFSYLVLCVGVHMAPSRSDYAGSGKGAVLLIFAILGVSSVVSLSPIIVHDISEVFLTIAIQLWFLFGIAILLILVSASIVWVVTIAWDWVAK